MVSICFLIDVKQQQWNIMHIRTDIERHFQRIEQELIV